MKIITGNDLRTGDVIWWTGSGWSRHVGDAADVGEDGASVIAREEAAQRANASYVLEAEATSAGPRPLHIKERVRAAGPSVRPDLGIHPELPLVKA